jgi:creatinine amidohydrolase/Fe(II)-dependent formamide hydrolase-like protein
MRKHWVALALLAPALAMAQATVRLEDLTWTEVRDRVAAGTTIALIPVGGTEQNGPHMVLGKHNVRVRVLADEIARRATGTVVAPVVSYAPEQGHSRYPGTLSIGESAFEGLLEGAARSLERHGFRDIFFLGDHGGYQKSLERVAARLNREWRARLARAHVLASYYGAVETKYPQMLSERGFSQAEIGTHAGLADTSLALAVDKSLVRSGRLATTAPDKDGVHGDPRRANSELGQLGAREIVESSVAEIRRVAPR